MARPVTGTHFIREHAVILTPFLKFFLQSCESSLSITHSEHVLGLTVDMPHSYSRSRSRDFSSDMPMLVTRGDATRRDTTRRDTTRHDTTRRDAMRHDTTRIKHGIPTILRLVEHDFVDLDMYFSTISHVYALCYTLQG